MPLENRRVALVEDDAIMGESLAQRLTIEGATVSWWRSGEEAAGALASFRPEVVVCDIRLPDMCGEELFCRSAGFSAAPFLFITAYGDIEQAVRLMRLGARDYLTKPFAMAAFLGRLEGLIRPRNDRMSGALGVSQQMLEIEALLRRLADRSASILLTGETGTGKEVCARFIHQVSAARDEPFMAVNCAAIPADLLESELLGHEKGAFTGATTRHLGYAERARKGILFLDEIGDMPIGLQSKLLRLLEDRTFFRVGGEQPIPFRARVVTASNKSLAQAVEEKRFREDLLYRINVVTIDLPPLRARTDDIPWLLERFFDEMTENRESHLRGISSMAEEAALAYSWPGNVRELRNRIHRAVMLAQGDWIMPIDLMPQSGQPDAAASDVAPLAVARESAERREIQRALQSTDGQLMAAARLLGVSRTTLWEKMRRFGLAAS